jgi:hypothetical protein
MKYAENLITKRNLHIYKNRILKCEKYIKINNSCYALTASFIFWGDVGDTGDVFV